MVLKTEPTKETLGVIFKLYAAIVRLRTAATTAAAKPPADGSPNAAAGEKKKKQKEKEGGKGKGKGISAETSSPP